MCHHNPHYYYTGPVDNLQLAVTAYLLYYVSFIIIVVVVYMYAVYVRSFVILL